MIESYVDLTYRGLALGRRLKLTQVRPSTGYVELPAPMPVGTAIGISTEEGVMIEATVAEVHEQVGGSEAPAGMVVKPKLDAQAAQGWWKARVELPEDVKVEAAPAVGIVRSKRKSDGAVPELVDDGRNTAVMEAVSPSTTLEMPAVREPHDTQVVDVPPVRERAASPEGDESPNIVDDGKRTTAMAAVDLEALGLDPAGQAEPDPLHLGPSASQSGQMAAVGASDDDDDKSDTKNGGGGRKKRKRR